MTTPHDPPVDIVPTTPSADRYRRLNDMTGRAVTYQQPGEVVCDVDGIPTAVGPTTEVEGTLYAIVTRTELAAVGLSPEDVPNLRVIEA